MDEGSIPRGDWRIGDAYNSKKTGPLTVKLEPDPENDVHKTKRNPNSFRAHGDSRLKPGEASEGCIVCGPATRKEMVETGGTVTVTH